MKKLYRKSTVHPTPPPIRSDHLSLLLPAALLSLAAALPADDRHVLAYLVSCSAAADHEPSDRGPIYGCGCFACYTSFWARWDKSENRRLIHDIIDALEDSSPPPTQKKAQPKKERKKRGSRNKAVAPEPIRADSKPDPPPEEPGFAGESCSGGGGAQEERGSVRRIVSFIGEKIWGVWT